MNGIRVLSIAFALLFILVGCSADNPVTPGDRGAAGVDKGSPWVYATYLQDIVQPCPCLGEDVWFHGEFAYRYREMVTPSGQYLYRWQTVPTTPFAAPFVLEGLTSGTVFDYRNGGPVFEFILDGPADVHVVRDQEAYVAEDGRRLIASFDLQMTTNPDGELVVSWMNPFAIECRW